MPTLWSNARGIPRCRKSRATALGAPVSRHWATACSISPPRPPGWQANKLQWKNTNMLAVFTAMAMRGYITVHIARWRGSRALFEATGCRHWVSRCSDISNRTYQCQFLWCFSLSTCCKRAWVDIYAPIKNRGMTYQNDEKHWTNLTKYFAWAVKLPGS